MVPAHSTGGSGGLAERLDDLPVEIVLERFYERLVDGDAIAPLQPSRFHFLSRLG
jgi:hypothetical protein